MRVVLYLIHVDHLVLPSLDCKTGLHSDDNQKLDVVPVGEALRLCDSDTRHKASFEKIRPSLRWCISLYLLR